mmetsp:Transcript_19579/g.40542  ORF Transcript_19579/g.40542 Transcript_19579/m.40542 type:complete len:224 (+) Transcript_19579:406-1077(+)
MILHAQLKVAHHHGHFCARRHQNQKHRHEETHDVVQLMKPQCTHDEEQLDAHRTKRKKTRQKHGNWWISVVRHFGNESRNLVCFGGYLDLLRAEPKVASQKCQWSCHTRPQEENQKDCQKRHGRGSPDDCQKDIENHKHANDDGWEEDGCGQRILLPCLRIAKLVQTGRHIAPDASAKHIQHDHGCQGLAFLDGVQHSQHGSQQCEEESRSNLGSGSNHHTKD